MSLPLFNYAAKVIKVVDGDTIDFDVDLGFHASIDIRTRLLGINAPEMSTQAGKDAKAFVAGLMPEGARVQINTYREPGDKYGRWLAIVHLADGRVLNDVMLATGHAVPMKV